MLNSVSLIRFTALLPLSKREHFPFPTIRLMLVFRFNPRHYRHQRALATATCGNNRTSLRWTSSNYDRSSPRGTPNFSSPAVPRWQTHTLTSGKCTTTWHPGSISSLLPLHPSSGISSNSSSYTAMSTFCRLIIDALNQTSMRNV